MGHYTTYRLRGSAVRQPQRTEIYAGPTTRRFATLFSASVLGYASRFTTAYDALITEVHVQLIAVAHTSTVLYAGIHADSGGLPGSLIGAEVGINNNTIPTGTQVVTWTGLSSRVSSGQVLWVSLRIGSYSGADPGEPTYDPADSEIAQLNADGVWSFYSETSSIDAQVWGLVG
jgi:hypothetical protein